MIDQDDEIARFKWLLFASVAFIVSAYVSYGELKFAVRGQTADAQVIGIEATMSTGRRRRPQLTVSYNFTEADGTTRSEHDTVAVDWKPPQQDGLKVQYLPGVANSSRLLGNSNTFAVYIFFGCLAWLSFSLFKLWREASDAVHGSGRRRN